MLSFYSTLQWKQHSICEYNWWWNQCETPEFLPNISIWAKQGAREEGLSIHLGGHSRSRQRISGEWEREMMRPLHFCACCLAQHSVLKSSNKSTTTDLKKLHDIPASVPHVRGVATWSLTDNFLTSKFCQNTLWVTRQTWSPSCSTYSWVYIIAAGRV